MQQEDPAIVSFFIDAKRYIKMGQYRKLMKHVTIDLDSISTVTFKLKYCHYITHTSLKILRKYHRFKKNYIYLMHHIIKILQSWFQILQTEPINKYCILFPNYVIKTGLILLKHQKLFYLSNHLMMSIDSLNFQPWHQFHHIVYLKIKYYYALSWLQYLKLDLSEKFFFSFFKNFQKHQFPLNQELLIMLTFAFYNLSLLYEAQFKLLKAKECIKYMEWLMQYLPKNEQFENHLEKRIQQFTKRYQSFLEELVEINKIMKIPQKKYETTIQDEINEDLYEKFRYDKLNQIQLYQIKKQKDQKEQKEITSKRNSTLSLNQSSRNKTNKPKIGSLDQNQTSFFNQSTTILNSTTSRQFENPHRRLFSARMESRICLSERRTTSNESKQNMDLYIDTMIQDKLSNKGSHKDFQEVKQDIECIKFINKKFKDDTDFHKKMLSNRIEQLNGQIEHRKFCSNMHSSERKEGYMGEKTRTITKMRDLNQQGIVEAKKSVNVQKEQKNEIKKRMRKALMKKLLLENKQKNDKKARDTILKHSVELKLQNFRRLQRNEQNNQQKKEGKIIRVERVKQEEDQYEIYKKHQQRNHNAIKLVMEEFENANRSEVKEEIDKIQFQLSDRNNELANSCYLNFVEDKMKKANNFKELAWNQYQNIRAKKLKNRN